MNVNVRGHDNYGFFQGFCRRLHHELTFTADMARSLGLTTYDNYHTFLLTPTYTKMAKLCQPIRPDGNGSKIELNIIEPQVILFNIWEAVMLLD